MSRTLPPMMQVMRDIGGVEIPETLATLAGVERKAATNGHPANAAAGKAPSRNRKRRIAAEGLKKTLRYCFPLLLKSSPYSPRYTCCMSTFFFEVNGPGFASSARIAAIIENLASMSSA